MLLADLTSSRAGLLSGDVQEDSELTFTISGGELTFKKQAAMAS